MRAAWDVRRIVKWHGLHWSRAERGIGAAISEALLKAGYCVAATYAGNDAAAKAFRTKTGAAVYRWDASDFEACATGIREVEAAVGPVDSWSTTPGSSAIAPCIR